ncbi:ArsR family transcriptional regulator [Salinadaptatus halalkaliphilus]|uniref:ArsR family transcriptional regulator n=1 Tax=Salinadaptatus halalkaliphilus TaxID=2419781 RepID=A0A4S3TJH6_9EURY|nr:winged helix-turn-helix domain-containing protein [Salinadaptatus halalkaliphilus]THE63055.1 ArsR family transcriptional regulator [Salinadaptatus halalkaliphilus]
MALERSSPADEQDLETVVGVLNDAGCRRIVAVLEEPMTVDEIAEATDQPQSTTYRKLDRLTEASLVTETTGVRRGRYQKARYVTDFDRVTVDLDDDRELRATVDRSPNRALGIWSNVRREP